MCSKKYSKERYHWLKEHHICVRCGQEDALKNSNFCLVCREDIKAKQRKNYNKKAKNKTYRENEAKRKREAYLKAKKEHRCVKCGKQLKENYSKVECKKCMGKKYNKYKPRDGYDRSERPNYGRCYICGKDELYSKSLCKKCYQRLQETNKRVQMNPTPAMIIARKEYSNYFKIIFKSNKNRKEKIYV